MLSRLERTSQGLVEFRIAYTRLLGLRVEARKFGEDGWELPAPWPDTWRSKDRKRLPLPDFLEERLGVPEEEAHTLATAIEGPWLDRWSRSDDATSYTAAARVTSVMMVVLGLIVLLAVLGVGLAIWLIVR